MKTKIEGIVTYEYKTQKGTKIKLGRKNAYLPFHIQTSLIGARLELEGIWKDKKSRYFHAENFKILKTFTDEEKANALMKVEKMVEKEGLKIPVSFQTEIGKDILAMLYQTGHPAIIKKILNARKNTQNDIVLNPYTLYLKKYSDFFIAEILARRNPFLKTKQKIYPLTLHILETAYRNRQESKELKEIAAIISRHLNEEINEVDVLVSIPDNARVKVDNGKAYLNWVFWCKYYVLNKLKTNPPYVVEDTGIPDLDKILSYKYSAITGPAGSGKTTIVRKLKEVSKEKVVLSAMTGKAARVLSKDARTVHDLLGYSRTHRGKFDKTHIDGILVVDEASMLDWVTAHAILRSAERVVFVGDPDQLPPVKGEPVFREIIKHLPAVRLTKIHRQKDDHEVIVIGRKDYSGVLTTTKTLAASFLKQAKKCQIITPLVEVAHELNLQIKRDILRKKTDAFDSGDRIIVNKNIYADGLLVVSNGDTGVVIRKEDEEFYMVNVRGNIIMLRQNEMELAYALTVHKAQGSEYDYVIFAIPPGVRRDFITEEMQYVGKTRGKIKTYVVTGIES